MLHHMAPVQGPRGASREMWEGVNSQSTTAYGHLCPDLWGGSVCVQRCSWSALSDLPAGKWLVLLRGMSLGPGGGKRTERPLMDKAIRKDFMEEVAFALGLDG